MKTGHAFVPDRRVEGWWKTLKDLCMRCKIKTWPKLGHNLRASCQTDLCRTSPFHPVCIWLGNSLRVAEQRYLQVTPDDMKRAHICAHCSPDLGRREQTEKPQNLPKTPEMPINVGIVEGVEWAVQDLNYPSKCPKKQEVTTLGDAKCDARIAKVSIPPDLMALARVWLALPSEIRKSILTMAKFAAGE